MCLLQINELEEMCRKCILFCVLISCVGLSYVIGEDERFRNENHERLMVGHGGMRKENAA